MSRVYRYSSLRRWALVFLGLSYVVSIVSDLDLLQNRFNELIPAFQLTNAIAGVIWILGLCAFFFTRRLLGLSKSDQHALNDELVQQNQYRAFTYAHGALMLLAAVLFLILRTAGGALSSADVSRLFLLTGVVAPMLIFAWLEGRDG